MEKGLGWSGRRKGLFTPSTAPDQRVRDEIRTQRWVGLCWPGREDLPSLRAVPPPHCTVTSRPWLPFFLKLSLPFPLLLGPWVTLTVTLLSLNFTENLEGEEAKG